MLYHSAPNLSRLFSGSRRAEREFRKKNQFFLFLIVQYAQLFLRKIVKTNRSDLFL